MLFKRWGNKSHWNVLKTKCFKFSHFWGVIYGSIKMWQTLQLLLNCLPYFLLRVCPGQWLEAWEATRDTCCPLFTVCKHWNGCSAAAICKVQIINLVWKPRTSRPRQAALLTTNAHNSLASQWRDSGVLSPDTSLESSKYIAIYS